MKDARPEEVRVYIPVPDHDAVSNGLRRITRKLIRFGFSRGGFGFGGEDGYGADYENDVFEMHYDRQHPRCDCGGSTPKHTDDCARSAGRVQDWLYRRMDSLPSGRFFGQDEWDSCFARFERENPYPSCSCGEEAAWRERHPGVEPNDDGLSSPHPSDFEHARSCDWSIVYRPQFTHKPSGSTVEWYKYIGRDSEPKLTVPWKQIERECLRSIVKEGRS